MIAAPGQKQEHRPMGTPPNRLSVPDASSPTGHSSSSAKSSTLAGEVKIDPTSRYVLPNDLDAAIRYLDDQQLDKLVSAALEERARRRRPLSSDKGRRDAEVVSPLPQGKLNAVRAAFKAGVTPARIAREFGISRSDVQRALAGDAKN